MSESYKYLFGPVPSRRLGRSLGVDLVPFKTCSTNCVFCQLGPVGHCTIIRRDYVPLMEVLKELRQWMASDGKADYVTLSGSGEPTLHSSFGKVLRWVHQNSSMKTVLLSNSSLFHLSEVRQDASEADIVKVSLSAWDQASFEKVNRPHPDLHFEQMVEGLHQFRSEYKGSLWMEVFIVPGLNAHPDEVRKIAAVASTLRPDRIQLNTAVRPPAESFVQAVPPDYLQKLSLLFAPQAEVIASFKPGEKASMILNEKTVRRLIALHPSTVEQLAHITGHSEAAVQSVLDQLGSHLMKSEHNGALYYTLSASV
jgi:wyosine [tRNA(Phe)-imidazoG37] synthetase (radical SAM superfamily)